MELMSYIYIYNMKSMSYTYTYKLGKLCRKLCLFIVAFLEYRGVYMAW